MTIDKQINGTTLNIALKGRLDTTTAPELESALKEAMNGATALVIDMRELDYVSSAGLRVLLSAHKTMSKQGSMKVVHVNDLVQEVFEVTGFSDILNIE